jgi:hypothetical protein
MVPVNYGSATTCRNFVGRAEQCWAGSEDKLDRHEEINSADTIAPARANALELPVLARSSRERA